MKNEKYMFKILKNIVNKENIDNISKYLIYPDNKGYVAYGEYKIKTNNLGEIIVEKDKTHTLKIFNSLRNAIIWATFDKSNKIMYCKKIEELDILLASIDTNIKIQKNRIKGGKNLENISLAHTKITEETCKRTYLLTELENLILVSKSLQEQYFGKLIK
jgi:hypothetical protein